MVAVVVLVVYGGGGGVWGGSGGGGGGGLNYVLFNVKVFIVIIDMFYCLNILVCFIYILPFE